MTSDGTHRGPARTPEDLSRTIESAKQDLERMIDLNPLGMLLVDRDGRVVRTNRALLGLLGLADFRAALGRRLPELFPGPDAGYFATLLRGSAGAAPSDRAVRLGSGREPVLRFTVVASDRGGRDLSVLIVADATMEQQQTAQLEQQFKKQAAQELMGALMHAINQPLTVIMVKAQLLHMALEDKSARIAELQTSLREIMSLTMQVSELLGRMENPREFVTQEYLHGIRILDAARSGCSGASPEEGILRVLQALLALMEAHAPGLAQHGSRTAAAAAALARELALDEPEVGRIARAASLHDLGAIGIPDRLLQRRDSLGGADAELLKRHTEFGYRLLRELAFLDADAQVAYAHHEHWDGTGYPRGLKGASIPQAARVVAAANVFDNLRAGREGPAPLTAAQAAARIAAGAGTRFDPQVAAALEACCRRGDPPFGDTTV